MSLFSKANGKKKHLLPLLYAACGVVFAGLALCLILVGSRTWLWMLLELTVFAAFVLFIGENMSRRYYAREAELEAQSRNLAAMNDGLVGFTAGLVEARDEASGEHVHRVKSFTWLLAQRVMETCPEYELTDRKIGFIASASVLHDVGKIMISDTILLKPGRLTPEEFEIMKTHTVRGCEILKLIPADWDDMYKQFSMEICRWHHEKYDGSGYPDGLVGDEIPISAQIVSLADCYDALVTERVYKPPFSPEQAFDMICSGQCGQFSEKLLRCFRDVRESFENQLSDPLAVYSSEVDENALRGLRVLLVEDSDLNREMACDALEDDGALVTEAVNGREAVDRFAADGGRFDVILMDVLMPVMDGLEATKAIRALSVKGAKTVPIVALTANRDKDLEERCLAAGMNDFLQKPIDVANLVHTLKKF